MTPQNHAIHEISAQAKELLAAISALTSFIPPTTEGETLNAILESSKNRIEGAVENAKVAFRYYSERTNEISPDEKTEPQV